MCIVTDNDNLKVTSRSGREIKKANDPLNNIATMKGKSYVNVSERTSKRTKFEETGKKVQFSDENVARMKEIQYNFFTQGLEDDKHHEYGKATAGVIASCIQEIKDGVGRDGMNFVQQFSMRKSSRYCLKDHLLS